MFVLSRPKMVARNADDGGYRVNNKADSVTAPYRQACQYPESGQKLQVILLLGGTRVNSTNWWTEFY